jgi:flagellar motility protein MotE (MotC chaperone)
VVIATPSPEQVEASAALLVDVLKKMKPALAAQMMAEWDDLLTIGLLRRLGSRRAAPILSKMPVDMSGRLTRRIAAGEGAMPQGEAK